MNNVIQWQVMWRELTRTALQYCEDHGYSRSRVERAIGLLHRHYGDDWIERRLHQGHPLLALLCTWPSVCEFAEFFDLLEFASSSHGSSEQIVDLVNRTKESSRLHFFSVFEELRVLYCLNKVGLPARRLPENQKKSKRKDPERSQDLIVDGSYPTFNIEVTQLLATNEMLRTNLAWEQLTDLHFFTWGRPCSLIISGRPFSQRHVQHMASGMHVAMTRAESDGVAIYEEPGMITYVTWTEGHEEEANRLLTERGLEPGQITMDTRFSSTVAPFRVIQKITDKARQASDAPWLLVIRATDGMVDESHAVLLAQEVSEYVYDHDNLLGVVLYYRWQHWGAGDPLGIFDMDTPQVRVASTQVRPGHYQQTTIIKNSFCKFYELDDVYDRVRQIALELGWEKRPSENGLG